MRGTHSPFYLRLLLAGAMAVGVACGGAPATNMPSTQSPSPTASQPPSPTPTQTETPRETPTQTPMETQTPTPSDTPEPTTGDCYRNEMPVAEFIVSNARGMMGDLYIHDREQDMNVDASMSRDDGSIAIYRWDVNGEMRQSGPRSNLLLAGLDEGFYDITLLVTDDCGATTSTDGRVFVTKYTDGNAHPYAEASGAVAEFPDNVVPSWRPYTFDFSESGSGSFDPDGMIVNYEIWSGMDGERIPRNRTDGILRTQYIEEGTYTLTLTVTDNDGATTTDTATYIARDDVGR